MLHSVVWKKITDFPNTIFPPYYSHIFHLEEGSSRFRETGTYMPDYTASHSKEETLLIKPRGSLQKRINLPTEDRV
jgi:hypothetical protein